ncbi:lipolytic protein G-D-S-L family [Pseudobacteroides cellulosolvens ATCC 35603 = DSM 2933]|uniref:Lipolytic protein G-D-S-L family n=2 Tax=Pseudobacteroides cellulosolvens TaxID=35825 RepID=A0A0L6JN60_9FIRM|nr:lipolytic protein G-D-S-L family [Pseudobacteroides cellulosolvens ATCC 35603 = DSM 2933]
MKVKLSVLPALILASLSLMLVALCPVHAYAAASYKISGYIAPDFKFNESQAAVLKSGFTAELAGTSFKAQTDIEGFFSISGIPETTSGTLVIKKSGYLARNISFTNIKSDISIGPKEGPVDIWPGDIDASGVINMSDIILMAGSFNAVKEDSKYNESCDFNLNGAINMEDVLFVAKRFGNTSENYPAAKLVMTTPSATPTPSSPSGTPGIRYDGRFDFTNPQSPKFAWTGSSIVANFSGTEVSATLKSTGENWFQAIVDGKVMTPFMVNSQSTVKLASGLTNGEHQIVLWKRTEASQGEVQFLGFNFGSGKLLAPPPAPERKIEFIGDSITCAYGNEGTSKDQPFTPKNENSYLSYAAITARSLNASANFIAWSGIGITMNYGGAGGQLIQDRYLMTLPQSGVQWDFKKYIPHAVVINIGTNDFSTVTPDKTKFINNYKALISKIRTNYPDAHIFCTIGPMMWGSGLESCKSYVTDVVNDFKSKGDLKVYMMEYPQQSETNGYGEDWHPSLKTHQLMADQLTKEIKTKLGW